MIETLRTRLLAALRVPPEPAPPEGAPGSVRVFRAGRAFYRLRLARWALGQLAALAGILFSLAVLERMDDYARKVRAEALRPGVAEAAAAPASAVAAEPEGAPKPSAKARARGTSWPQVATRLARNWPPWVFPLLRLVEFGGLLLYLLQLPMTWALVRLDYELRWYIVTDRSLRIRCGLAVVQESTMSFANLQQVVVSQNPLQRLLGIADVCVRSAGGGGDQPRAHAESLHVGTFHGVDNAAEIRDLILERLRRYRDAGLGDTDDRREAATGAPEGSLAAARELLAEARALRRSLG